MLLAHAFGARYDLPIPLYLFVGGGALVVLASFAFVVPKVVDGIAERTPDRPRLRRGSPAVDAISLVALAFLAYCGLAGSQEVAANILPTSFWLLAWIAVPLLCGILGDWTQPVNPFAIISRRFDDAALRRRVLGSARAVGWPKALGWWPAVVLFFGGVLGELVFNVTATVPHVLATGLIGYAALCALMGLIFGAGWRRHGEVFTVLFSTWGRLGWWRFGAPGRRGLGGGLDADIEPTASRVAFVLLLLISVNFDGLLTTPQWQRFERGLPDQVGLDPGRVEIFRSVSFLVLTIGLLAAFGLFALVAVRIGRQRLGDSALGPRGSLARLVPSLLPIAFGYLFVHNLQYVLVNAQLMLPLIGNPTGLSSWPVSLPFPFNDSFEPHAHFLPSAFYWYVGVVVIIAVHVLAVLVAHRHLAPVSSDDSAESRARRSEYPWLVAMVAYTMASLWLIAQPFTESAPAAKTPTVSGATAQTTGTTGG